MRLRHPITSKFSKGACPWIPYLHSQCLPMADKLAPPNLRYCLRPYNIMALILLILHHKTQLQFYLAAIPDHLSHSLLSVATPYIRPISRGQQCYTPNPSDFPVGQPMTKVTAKLQVITVTVIILCIIYIAMHMQ